MAVWESVANVLYSSNSTTFTKESAETLYGSPIRSNTWQALFTHGVLSKEGNLLPRTEKAHNKTNNQDFGKYFELCVSARSKGSTEPPAWEHYNFDEATRQEIFADAAKVLPFLDSPVDWAGNETVSGNGDLRGQNGKVIEIKYLNNDSTGTYYNASIYKLVPFGFNLQDYMESLHYYDLLEETFPEYTPNRNNKSPYSSEIAKIIVKDDRYERIIRPAAQNLMKTFTNDFIEYFSKNPAELSKLVYLFLNKDKNKSMPDQFLCFNYNTKICREIDLKNLNVNPNRIKATEKGVVIDDTLRVQFSWKNGYGLYNCAIYVFIEKG